VEKGKLKCHRYWPQNGDGSPGACSTHAGIQVQHVSTERSSLWLVRTFVVTPPGGACPWKLRQFAYTAWPDHGVPADVTELLLLRTAVREHYTNTSVPMVVHCSAGVGRTGTFIAIDQAIEQLEKARVAVVDPHAIVKALRTARMHMVQTVGQYECIFSAVQVAIDRLLDKARSVLELETAAAATAATATATMGDDTTPGAERPRDSEPREQLAAAGAGGGEVIDVGLVVRHIHTGEHAVVTSTSAKRFGINGLANRQNPSMWRAVPLQVSDA